MPAAHIFSATVDGHVPLTPSDTTKFLRADATFAVPAGTAPDVVTGIVAFAGGGQASATQLAGVYTVNIIATCATNGDSVKLPVSTAGARVYVINEGAAVLWVYPRTGGTIDSSAANAAVKINPGVVWTFIGQDASNNWAALRSYLFSGTVPSALGTAAVGTSENVTRRDHVHPAADLSTAQVTGVLPLANVADIASGTYTLTLTNVTNIAASTAYQCQYLRVGGVVTVSGKVDVDPTAATLTQLGISLPIASNIGAVEDCAGAASASVLSGQ